MLISADVHTVNIDDQLLEAAIEATGEKERTKLLHDGLRALIARENARAIIALGSAPDAGWQALDSR